MLAHWWQHSHTELHGACRVREGFLFSLMQAVTSRWIINGFSPWSWSPCLPPSSCCGGVTLPCSAVSFSPSALSPTLGANLHPPRLALPSSRPVFWPSALQFFAFSVAARSISLFLLCFKAGQLLFCGTRRGAALSPQLSFLPRNCRFVLMLLEMFSTV